MRARLEQRLKVDQERLMQELVDQPRLFYLAAIERVHAARKRANLELELQAVKADVASRVRSENQRATVQIVNEKVAADVRVKEIAKRLVDAELEEEAAKLLVEAFRQRRECLGLLLEQNRAEMGAGAVRKRARDKYPGR